MNLFRNNKQLQIGTSDLMANHAEILRTKGKTWGDFRGKEDSREAVANKEFIGGNWEFKAWIFIS